MNPVDKAISVCGGLQGLAGRLGVSPNTIINWRSRGVPIEKCASVELATDGEVTRRDLRPLDWQRIWPELTAIPQHRRKLKRPQA